MSLSGNYIFAEGARALAALTGLGMLDLEGTMDMPAELS
jgi:hypothetical protein